MLVSFSVSNFRSFDGEQTFSMVASNRLAGNHEGHTVAIPDSDSKVLRAGVIYGANGAGKSNLFKALRLLKTIATGTRKKDAPIRRDAFRFGGGTNLPSTFDLQFVMFGRFYRFGVKFDDIQVIEEWLVRFDEGRERIVYERMTAPDGEVTVELGAISKKNEKLTALAKIGGLRNQSFLATTFSTLSQDVPIELSHTFFWFTLLLQLVSPQQSERNIAASKSPGLREFAGEFLKASSTGVDHLDIVESSLTPDEFRSLIPRETAPAETDIAGQEPWERSLSNGDIMKMARTLDGVRYSRLRLRAAHRTKAGETVPLDIHQESDGTRRLLQLLPALHTLKNAPAVYVIDEVDRSLHPMLARTYLEFFLNSCQNEKRQLIMTTHESSLLDQDLLRRDEIWFAEKDDAGATSLYSLLDFKIRNDLDIRKNYLQGRFGAIPFLGGIQRLMDREGKAE